MRTWKIAQAFTFACLAGCGSGPTPVLAPEVRPHPMRQRTTAKQVLAYLTSLPLRSERRLLSGQNVGHGPTAAKGYDAYVGKLHEATGKWPAFVTADYAFGSVNAGWIDQVNQTVKGHWDAGGLVSINIASLNNPLTGGNCKDRGFGLPVGPKSTPGATPTPAFSRSSKTKGRARRLQSIDEIHRLRLRFVTVCRAAGTTSPCRR